MKSPSAAVLAQVHSSLAGANTHGVLGRAPAGWVLEPGPQRLGSLGSPGAVATTPRLSAAAPYGSEGPSYPNFGRILPRGSARDFSSSSTTLWNFFQRQVSCEIHTEFLLCWQRTSYLGFLLLSTSHSIKPTHLTGG